MIVGVVVFVAVALGLGETVHVGDGVFVGSNVRVAVSVGTIVCVTIAVIGVELLHAISSQAIINDQMMSLCEVLLCNGV